MDQNPNKSRATQSIILCDFCNEEIAVIYCRADSAKLCLFCDQHVHSANALSRKHLRSQICDNCSSQPVSVRCSTDHLVLCQDCDWDAHGSCSLSATHERCPVEGFSGCPSALELSSIWGFNLADKKHAMQLPQSQVSQMGSDNFMMFPNWGSLNSVVSDDSWVYKSAAMTLQDLMLPSENGNSGTSMYPSVPSADIPLLSKKLSSSCGKQTQVIFKQLVELLKRDPVRGDGGGGGDGLGPGTPAQQSNMEDLELPDGGDGATDATQLLHQQTPFTSLLMLSTRMDLREINNRLIEDNIPWDCNPSDQAAQVWDFNLGKSRDHDEAGPLEAQYAASDAGFMFKSYQDLIKETPLPAKKVYDNIYDISYSMAHDNKSSQNNNSNNPAASQGPTTSESNNFPLRKPSSSSSLGKYKTYSGTRDVDFMEQSVFLRSDTLKPATTKADMELLAQNRGNAMLRYKEKKKTRRHDPRTINTSGMSRGRPGLILGSV
ncbi:PREDICTED: zinc finger protein CONSTANS-LIKE 14-like isoform X2 [Nelumbo nucifera]|uniref:B box-type domain-containing protein n=2 Tax=Nelumbo nucifera TaxID=4432 RepID=A0A822YNN7_NELNU|nr:PREDICTED: zinc finger protein CONSTANS-LIKE 14-like isoform X2 [Nelumbo nucifera]DAD34137.1 TPA_asm: hypothetical protein HUJ06_004777 [Nelumbo nucifera]